MKSMTGFGRSSSRTFSSAKGKSKARASVSKAAPAAELDISVKSVNGRFLDVRFHLPREYAGLEGEFKSLIAQVFSRGTLDVYINRIRKPGEASLSVNFELAEQWLKGYRELGKRLKLKSPASLDLLSRMPEVFKIEGEGVGEISDAERKLVKDLLKEAALACDQERIREGKALASELAQLCGRLERLASEAEGLKGEANAELERRLRDRLHESLQKRGFEGKVDDQRIAQEIVIYLDRADISEELTRLREHLKAYQDLLKSPEAQGKKLDFYAQELLREVNTIGSKSHIAALTSRVVDAKTLVEKIREQVQNVE